MIAPGDILPALEKSYADMQQEIKDDDVNKLRDMRKHLAKIRQQQSNQENVNENKGKSIAIDSPEPVDEIRITPETNVNYNIHGRARHINVSNGILGSASF